MSARQRFEQIMRESDLMQTLLECAEYFDGRADAELGPLGTPVPNEEMRLLGNIKLAQSVIDRAIAAAEKSSA